MPNRNRYAVIRYSELTDRHLELIRTTGINAHRETLLTTPDRVSPKLCLVKWDHEISQQIPEALAAIQLIIDAGIPIWTEQEARDYFADPYCDFLEDPAGSSSSSSSIDSSSSSSSVNIN